MSSAAIAIAVAVGAPNEARAPSVIDGRYALDGEIGRGSTGVVWDARDLRTGEPVAIKVLHPSLLAAPAAISRFRREVASAQSLDHPHTVRVLAYGQTADGNQYLVMERLRGQTLSAHLANGLPLPLPRAFRIVAQILDAMAAAHRLNIVHRDVKPGNVVLIESKDGGDFVKVCDFGLAKVFDPNAYDDADGNVAPSPPGSMATGQGDMCGTPEFMAPEQARGEPLDGRADLYSIAVILFQVVTGQLPFRGRTPFAIVSQHLGVAPPRPSTLRPDLRISPALDNLILRGLAKDRRERPSSAEVFRADLLQIESDLLRDERRQAKRQGGTPEAATLPTAPAERRSTSRAVPLILAGVAIVISGAAIAMLRTGGGQDTHQPMATGAPQGEVASRPAPTVAAHLVGATVRAPIAPPPTAAPEPEVLPSPTRDLSDATTANERGRKARANSRETSRPATAVLPKVGASMAERPVPPPDSPLPNTNAAPIAVSPEPVASPVPASAVAERTDDDEGVLRRAEDLMAKGRVSEACALVETASHRQPRAAPLFAFLGRCYLRIGRRDEGVTSYRKYLELAPSAADAPFVRAIVERRR